MNDPTSDHYPAAACKCGHTLRQHQTAQGYCAYCDCESFDRADVKAGPTGVQLKQEAPVSAQPAAPTQPTPTFGQPSAAVLGNLDAYYRDNLLCLLKEVPEANTGDWYQEFINALEETGANPKKANSAPGKIRAAINAEEPRLKKELLRVAKEGTPGVMHDVDKSFYKLAIKERDAERHRVNRLTAEVKELKDKIKEMALQSLTSEGEWMEMTKELNDKLATLKRSGEVCQCCVENECDCMEGVTWGEGSGSDTVDEGADELPRQEE